MPSSIPSRLRILLVTAYIECALICCYLGFVAWNYIQRQYYEVDAIILNIMISAPFLCHSILVIILLKKNFPSREVNKGSRILYIISTVLTALFQVFALVGLIGSVMDRSMGYGDSDIDSAPYSNPIFIIILLALALILILQIYNSIEGSRLLRLIRRNSRKELLDSF